MSTTLEFRIQAPDLPAEPATLYDPIRYTLALGGKRIRPRLVQLGAGLVGGDTEAAIPAACAIEWLHNFTLIHDDIMDQADTRRGQPTVYRRWDVPTAILSGDALFATACRELLAYAAHPAFADIQRRFLDVVIEVCEGQAYDLEFEALESVSIDRYLEMIRLKTSVLLRSALEIGCVVGGGFPDQTDAAGRIGLDAGLAFQIQDDLMDALADPEKFGKRPGGDIRAGKKTYLTLLLLERADTADRAWVCGILAGKSATDSDIARMVRLFHQYGVISDTESRIRAYYEEALALLTTFPDSPARSELHHLLDQLTRRES